MAELPAGRRLLVPDPLWRQHSSVGGTSSGGGRVDCRYVLEEIQPALEHLVERREKEAETGGFRVATEKESGRNIVNSPDLHQSL